MNSGGRWFSDARRDSDTVTSVPKGRAPTVKTLATPSDHVCTVTATL
jgi:hypothetical protein